MFKIHGDGAGDLIKIKLHEFVISGDCLEDDHIYLRVTGEIYGPYCPSIIRKRRSATWTDYADYDDVIIDYTEDTEAEDTESVRHFHSFGVDLDEETTAQPTTIIPATTEAGTATTIDFTAATATTAVPIPDDATYKTPTSSNGADAVMEAELEGTFASKDVDVIYVTAPGGYQFRFKFSFEWELIYDPSLAGGAYHNQTRPSVDEFGVPLDPSGMCEVGHFLAPSTAIVTALANTANNAKMTLDVFNMISRSMAAFAGNFAESGTEFCSEETQLMFPCEMFRFQKAHHDRKRRSFHAHVTAPPATNAAPPATTGAPVATTPDHHSDDHSDVEWATTLQEVVGTLKAMLNTILSGCVEGFGFQWLEAMKALEMHVGGVIPDIIIPEISHHHGPHGGHPGGHPHGPHGGHPGDDPHGPHGGHGDDNHGPHGGHPGGDPHGPHGGHPGDDPHGPHGGHGGTDPTEAPVVPESTLVWDKSIYSALSDKPRKCPNSWSASSMSSVDNPLVDDGLSDRDNKCEVKYLQACTASKFDRLLGPHCNKSLMSRTFAKVVSELSRVASAGEGDRHCIFRTDMVQCDMMNFFELETAHEYIEKVTALATVIFENCGKAALEDAIRPHLLKLKEMVEDEDCSNRGLGLDLDWEPETTTSPVTTTSSPVTRGGEAREVLLYLNAERCPARSFGGRAAVTFNARSFNVVNLEHARKNYAELTDVLSKLDDRSIKQLGDFECELKGGKLPCDLMQLPRNEEGCQLTQRVERLYFFVRSQCDSSFGAKYDSLLAELVKNSRPAHGDCLPPGEPIPATEIKYMSKLYREEFGGIDYKQALRDATEYSRTAYREQAKERRRTVQMEKNRKAETTFLKAKLKLEAQQKKMQEIMARRLGRPNMQNDAFGFGPKFEEREICSIDQEMVQIFERNALEKYRAGLTAIRTSKMQDISRLARHYKFVIKPR